MPSAAVLSCPSWLVLTQTSADSCPHPAAPLLPSEACLLQLQPTCKKHGTTMHEDSHCKFNYNLSTPGWQPFNNSKLLHAMRLNQQICIVFMSSALLLSHQVILQKIQVVFFKSMTCWRSNIAELMITMHHCKFHPSDTKHQCCNHKLLQLVWRSCTATRVIGIQNESRSQNREACTAEEEEKAVSAESQLNSKAEIGPSD